MKYLLKFFGVPNIPSIPVIKSNIQNYLINIGSEAYDQLYKRCSYCINPILKACWPYAIIIVCTLIAALIVGYWFNAVLLLITFSSMTMAVNFYFFNVHERKKSVLANTLVNGGTNYCMNGTGGDTVVDFMATEKFSSRVNMMGLTLIEKFDHEINCLRSFKEFYFVPLINSKNCFSIMCLVDSKFYLVINSDWGANNNDYKCCFLGNVETVTIFSQVANATRLLEDKSFVLMKGSDDLVSNLKESIKYQIFGKEVRVFKFANDFVFFVGMKVALSRFKLEDPKYYHFKILCEKYSICLFELVRTIFMITKDGKDALEVIHSGLISLPLFLQFCECIVKRFNIHIRVCWRNNNKFYEFGDYSTKHCVSVTLTGHFEYWKEKKFYKKYSKDKVDIEKIVVGQAKL